MPAQTRSMAKKAIATPQPAILPKMESPILGRGTPDSLSWRFLGNPILIIEKMRDAIDLIGQARIRISLPASSDGLQDGIDTLNYVQAVLKHADDALRHHRSLDDALCSAGFGGHHLTDDALALYDTAFKAFTQVHSEYTERICSGARTAFQ